MSWDNYGKIQGCWQIDHKRPLASFNLSKLDEQAVCFHYANLQPLWTNDNLRKSDRFCPACEMRAQAKEKPAKRVGIRKQDWHEWITLGYNYQQPLAINPEISSLSYAM
jgi:hypothetical protein